MKIIVLALVLISCIAFPSMAHSQSACQSLGEITASGVASAHGGVLCRAIVSADGTNSCTVTFYDSKTTATGTKIGYANVLAGETMGGFSGDNTAFSIGLYVEITGTNCKVIPSAR